MPPQTRAAYSILLRGNCLGAANYSLVFHRPLYGRSIPASFFSTVSLELSPNLNAKRDVYLRRFAPLEIVW